MKLYRYCEDNLRKDSRTKALVAHAQEHALLVSLWIEEMHYR